jgi:hypothetical protein
MRTRTSERAISRIVSRGFFMVLLFSGLDLSPAYWFWPALWRVPVF